MTVSAQILDLKYITVYTTVIINNSMGLLFSVSLPSCAVVEFSLVLEVVFLTESWQVVETP